MNRLRRYEEKGLEKEEIKKETTCCRKQSVQRRRSLAFHFTKIPETQGIFHWVIESFLFFSSSVSWDDSICLRFNAKPVARRLRLTMKLATALTRIIVMNRRLQCAAANKCLK
jgi:hypothetical protein